MDFFKGGVSLSPPFVCLGLSINAEDSPVADNFAGDNLVAAGNPGVVGQGSFVAGSPAEDTPLVAGDSFVVVGNPVAVGVDSFVVILEEGH